MTNYHKPKEEQFVFIQKRAQERAKSVPVISVSNSKSQNSSVLKFY